MGQQGLQRMSRRQCAERADEILNFSVAGMHTDPSAELLQHVDAGSSIRCVHHEMHHTVGFECAAQSTQARIRVDEMMKNAGAYDLIETHPEVVHSLDVKSVNLQIRKVVFFLKLLGLAHAGCTAVDTGNLSRGPAQRMLGRLGCAAACDEDGLVFPIRSAGPKKVIVGAASLRVLPELLIPLQIVDRRRIGITVVEIPHFTCYIRRWGELCCVHCEYRIQKFPGRRLSAGESECQSTCSVAFAKGDLSNLPCQSS